MRLCPYNPEINYAPVQFCIDAIAKYEEQCSHRRGGCFGPSPGQQGKSSFPVLDVVPDFPPIAHEFTVTRYEMLTDVVRALLILLDVQLSWNDGAKWWDVVVPMGVGKPKAQAQFIGGTDEQWQYFLGKMKDTGEAPWVPEIH